MDIFEKYKDIKNAIFCDYYQNLKKIESEINSYEEKELEEWKMPSYIGFFKYLKKEKELLKHGKDRKNDCGWGYVNNPAGGFMALWWSPLSEEKIKEITGIDFDKNEFYEDIYLQIEQYNKNTENIISVKYSVNSKEKKYSKEDCEKLRKAASERRKKVYEQLSQQLKEKNQGEELEFQKKNFRVGRYMTVGYLKFKSIEDFEKKVKILQEAVINLEKL